MTGDEYLVKRILELEEENKALKNSKTIQFVFGTYYKLSKPYSCKVKIENDKVIVEEDKQDGNDWICNNTRN